MNLLLKYSPLWAPDLGGGGGGGGGDSPAAPTSSPSTSPSSPSPSTGPPSGGDGGAPSSDTTSTSVGEVSGDQDFAFLFEDSGDESAPLEAPAAVTKPTTVVKAVEAPKPQPVPEAAPSAPTEAQPQASAAGASGQLDPFDPGAIAAVLAMNESVAVQHVADTLFKLSNEEIEALENDTVSAIPRLLAKGMVKSQLNMLTQLSRLLPAMIQKHGETMKRHGANESKFYQRWPELKHDVHGPMVLKYGAVYRQMHPDATLETMIEELGPMVMMAARVPPSQPQVASRSNGVKRGAQPSPFTPAGAVAAGAIPQHAQELSPFEAMFLNDE